MCFIVVIHNVVRYIEPYCIIGKKRIAQLIKKLNKATKNKKMKKIILMLLVMLSIAESRATVNKQIPDNVLRSFSTKYPNIHVRKWSTRNDTDIAEFKMMKVKQYAYYLPNGTWIRTESEINHISDLPRAVKSSWHQCAFQTWYVEDVKRIETGNENLYVIQVIRKYIPGGFPGPENWNKSGVSPEEYKLYFDLNGSLLRKVQIN